MTSDFEKELYKNWVRGAKGLEYLQEGLHDFVGKKVKECRDKILQQIVQNLPDGLPNQCNQCTSDNLLPEHCDRRAACKKSKCIQSNPHHCFGSRPVNRRKCPNNICSKFYDKIVEHHSSADPAWNYTDPTTWCSDPLGWSYAQCFQTTIGKDECSSADTTDAAGLLSILINNLDMHNWLACKDMHSKVACPFYRARRMRNEILHSSKLEIEDLPLGFYLHMFMKVLQDSECLINFDDSKTAVNKLVQLQSNQITISQTDETKLVEMANQPKKEQLKKELAEFHRKEHSTIPLSPLFEENDTPLLDFYIMPAIKENNITIKSLSEVYKSDGKFNNEIYLTADAGFGKTAFSKYMTVLWRQAHFPDETCKEHFTDENVTCMAEFEFLFLVLLRDSSDVCSIDDLIYNQIVQNLSRSYSYSKQFLQEILHEERCLVVLDGLDEWTHPETCEKVPKCIPHRNIRDNCSILTTTRSWKLSIIRLNTKQIEKKIELTNFDSDSALELTTRALKKLKGKNNWDMKEEARSLIKKYHDFDQVHVPLLLMYIICLWCDDIPVGKSKCGLYTSIIELLLSRTISKYNKISQTEQPKCVSEIPECFKEQEHCNAYFTFLMSLGELAFQTLFSETIANRLVFDSSIAEKCLKEDFLELGRLTGIIKQDKQRKLTSQIRKTSFAHKTVQEFFSALYISACLEQNEVLTKVLSFCNSIQDILDQSKVFVFISGINAELFSLLSNELMKVINKDERTSEYRSTAMLVPQRPLENIQEMFCSCIKEIPDNKDVTICLQDFFFDKKCRQENYFRSLQRLALQNKTNITSIQIHRPGSRSLTEIIDSCELSDSKIQCQRLYCFCECKEEEIIRLLSTSVKCLYIDGMQRDNECKDARSSLTDEQCKTFYNSSQLETIRILRFTVCHKFLNSIINVKSLKEITLNILFCSEHESSRSDYVASNSEHESSSSEHESSCQVLNFDLSQHPELKKLELLFGNITFCEDVSSHLQKMRNIEYVDLRRVNMSSCYLHRFVEMIKQLEHSVIVVLELCEITPIEKFEDIKKYIHESESFDVEMDKWYRWGNIFKFVTRK